MKQLLIIQLVLYFGWLSCVALAQLDISGAITGSASFPHVGITCLLNLAVFITSFLRKRLHLEMGVRDFLVINASPFKFKEEYGNYFKNEVIARFATREYIKEASVVMLSNSAGMANSSIRQFMGYIQNVHGVHSVLLKYDILKDVKVLHSHCKPENGNHRCNCIIINYVEGLRVRRLLPESRVVLPCLNCLENGCYPGKPDVLHLGNQLDRSNGPNVLRVPDVLRVEFFSAVWNALDFKLTKPSQKEPICICVPVSYDDKWTRLLLRFLKYQDPDDNTDLVAAAEVLESYLDKRGKGNAEERTEDRAEIVKYKTLPLIVIRLVEILINFLLTVFFKVDGFSSSLAARRAVRSYVVDEKGKGLSVNSFLTSALVVVKSDSVCQVLKFRRNRTFLVIVGCFNLLFAIAWALVLIACNGGVGKWYAVPSVAPSKPRVAVIIGAICIGIVMDCFEFSSLVRECLRIFRNGRDFKKVWEEIKKDKRNQCMILLGIIWKEIKKNKQNICMILLVIILQIVFAVVVVALSLNKSIGRWVYGALQLLVWVKWGIGSSMIGAYSPDSTTSETGSDKDGRLILMSSSSDMVGQGSLVYCSSFFLNAVMVGVMGDWTGIWSTWK